MNKKFISAMMALVVVIGVSFTSVHADPASDKAKLAQTQTQRVDLETKVEIMDNQIETIMTNIKTNENDIATTQKSIKSSQVNLTKAENNIKTEQNLFDQRMRAMYMSGSTSYVAVLLGSKDLGDLISRLENLKKIISFDQNVINDYKTKETAIDLKKVALDTQNSKLLQLKTSNNNKLADLTKQKSDQTVLIAQLKTQESQYGIKLLADQKAVAASQVELANIRTAAPSTKISAPSSQTLTASIATPAPDPKASTSSSTKITPIIKNTAVTPKKSTPTLVASRGGATFSNNSVLAYASNFLGVPYVWGGSSPLGFDCSGFTQYVFAHFGVNLPRTSQSQQNVGTYETRGNLRAGDLVFFGNPAYHVGIYIGNGNMIAAPHTGDVVKIERLNSDFTGGRRVN